MPKTHSSNDAARLTISDVHQRTGIPVTTLRFYEKELPNFFQVEKTSGGHRRYTEDSVAQFQMVRRLVENEGVRISELRERLAPATDGAELRKHVDLLLSVFDNLTEQMEKLRNRVAALEGEINSMRRESRGSQQDGKKRRWF